MRAILAWFGFIAPQRFVRLDVRRHTGRRIVAYFMTEEGAENGPVHTKDDAHKRLRFLWNMGEVSPLLVLEIEQAINLSDLSDESIEPTDRVVMVQPGLRITLDVVGGSPRMA